MGPRPDSARMERTSGRTVMPVIPAHGLPERRNHRTGHLRSKGWSEFTAPGAPAMDSATWSSRYPRAFFLSLLQVSRRVAVRLNTGSPGAWSPESATK